MACSSLRKMLQVTVPCVAVVTGLIYFNLFQETQQQISIHRAGGSHKTEPDHHFAGWSNDEHDFEMYTPHEEVLFEEENVPLTFNSTISTPFLFAMLSSTIIGFTGIFPILFLNVETGKSIDDKIFLNRLLCFAVGGLLGDVFLHLLPESWQHLQHVDKDGKHSHMPALFNGLWILFGLISFTFLEKVMTESSNVKTSERQENSNSNTNNNKSITNGNSAIGNGFVASEKQFITSKEKSNTTSNIKMSGYLNLFANCIDNFTHGLAVGGSYLISVRVGLLTTLAIFLHELPHEIGDFAILLRAGFDKKRAAKLQLLTATGGLAGVLFAMWSSSAEEAGNRVAWVLPFTSGGFLYIALCTVVPDILKETDPRESLIQLFLIVFSIGIMGLVGLIH